MNEFLRMVLNELQEAIGQAIFVLLLAVGIAVYVYVKHKDRYKNKQAFTYFVHGVKHGTITLLPDG